jgi:hypothetical protein
MARAISEFSAFAAWRFGGMRGGELSQHWGVMAGLVPAIHAAPQVPSAEGRCYFGAWMAGTSPAKTVKPESRAIALA